MIITDIKVTTFTYTSNTVQDTDGHTHPGDPHEATTALLTITTEDGTSGYTFGSPDALRPVMMDNFIRKVLMGQDATDRERLWQAMARWQRGSGGAFNDRSPRPRRTRPLGLVRTQDRHASLENPRRNARQSPRIRLNNVRRRDSERPIHT